MDELKQTAADKKQIYDNLASDLDNARDEWSKAAIAVLEAETGIKTGDTCTYAAKSGKVEAAFNEQNEATYRFYALKQDGYNYSQKYQIVRDISRLRKD
jgi:NAD-specific glutamate dehydrogenase